MSEFVILILISIMLSCAACLYAHWLFDINLKATKNVANFTLELHERVHHLKDEIKKLKKWSNN